MEAGPDCDAPLDRPLRVLLYCDSATTAADEAIELAAALRAHRLETTIAFTIHDDRLLNKASVHGIRVFVDGARPGAKPSHAHWWERQPRAALRFLGRSGLLFLGELARQVHFYRIYRSFFARERFDCVVAFNDRTKGATPVLLKTCKGKGIPIAWLQISRTIQQRLAHQRLADPDYLPGPLATRLAQWFAPGHVKHFQGQPVLFYPMYRLIAWLLLGLSPKLPWHNGENFADLKLMISPAHLEAERREGAPCRNVRLVGQFSLDKLLTGLRDRERVRRTLMHTYFPTAHDDLPLLIIGLPQLFEHKVMDLDSAMEEIRHIIAALKTLKSAKVLISLHPKMRHELYKPLCTGSRNLCLLDKERLADAIPAADFYLCAFESTLPWGILCGIRTLFLDYFQLGFDVSRYTSCVKLTSRDHLSTDLTRAVAQGTASQNPALARSIQRDQQQFGVFSETCATRIANALWALTSNPQRIKDDRS
jgi:hypothetical protein